MRVLLDEMLDRVIAERLRERGHDATAVQGDAQLEGNTDPELLRAATALGRALVTGNVRDFARLHNQFIEAGEEHAGIVLVSPASFPRSKRTIGRWVGALDRYLEARRDASLTNLCDWLGDS